MAEKINFGKRTIDRLTIPVEGRARYHDTGNRFLYLDVFPSGRKTFLYVRKVTGKMNFIKLGSYPEMTPVEARNKADFSVFFYIILHIICIILHSTPLLVLFFERSKVNNHHKSLMLNVFNSFLTLLI